MKYKVTNILLSILSISIFSISCQEDEESLTPPVVSDTTVVDSTVAIDLKGYVQKGPFINGTAITLSELDKKLIATGKNFTTQIADNRGSFSLKDIKLKSNFVQLQAEGFYFDEVKGEKSAAQLTLFALADVADASSVNVNLLSHLERNRVVYLMQEEEQEFEQAKQQAQQEILVAFGIAADSIVYSEQLDISQEGDQNAILLAISAILQGNNSVAELSELLGNFITDLREDGIVNSEVIQKTLTEQAQSLDLSQIRQHLEERYAEMGVEATIPNFEQYIDSDGDGILNKDEDDTPEDFVFETQVDVAVNDTIFSNRVTISGIKEGGVAVAVADNGWLVVNGAVIKRELVEKNGRDTLSTSEVKNGDELQIKLTSSSLFADTTTATITIGTFKAAFNLVTDDYIPDTFSFSTIKDVAVDSLYTSEAITISGLPHFTAAKANNATIIKNGIAVETDPVMVSNGDELALQLKSVPKYASTSTATLDINGVSAEFLITTDDYTPHDFNISTIKNATLDSLYTSEPITLSGIPHPTPVFLDAGNLVVNGQTVNASEKTVSNGDQVSIQLKTANDFGITSSAALQIGTVTDSFHITTLPSLWQRKADFPKFEVEGMSGFVIGDKIYVGTGYSFAEDDSDLGVETFITDFYEYDTKIDLWTKKASFGGKARSHGIGFAINGKGYIGLGFATGGSSYHNEFQEYDPATDTWRQLADFPGSGSIGATSFTIGDYGYVGYGDETTSGMEFWRYSPNTDSWTQIARLPVSDMQRWHATGFAANEKGYIAMGYCQYNNCNDLWEYDPLVDSWTQLSNYPDDNHEGSLGFTIDDYAYLGSTVSSRTSKTPQSFWQYHLETGTWKEINLGSFDFSVRGNYDDTPHTFYTTKYGYHLRHVPNEGMLLYEFTPPQDPRYFITTP